MKWSSVSCMWARLSCRSSGRVEAPYRWACRWSPSTWIGAWWSRRQSNWPHRVDTRWSSCVSQVLFPRGIIASWQDQCSAVRISLRWDCAAGRGVAVAGYVRCWTVSPFHNWPLRRVWLDDSTNMDIVTTRSVGPSAKSAGPGWTCNRGLHRSYDHIVAEVMVHAMTTMTIWS